MILIGTFLHRAIFRMPELLRCPSSLRLRGGDRTKGLVRDRMGGCTVCVVCRGCIGHRQWQCPSCVKIRGRGPAYSNRVTQSQTARQGHRPPDLHIPFTYIVCSGEFSLAAWGMVERGAWCCSSAELLFSRILALHIRLSDTTLLRILCFF